MATPRKPGRGAQQDQQAEERPEAQALKIPLHWADIETKEFVCANEIFARYTHGAYWLTFGQVHGPYEVKPDKKQLENEGVFARPVARIAVTPEVLADFLRKLTDLYDRMSGTKNPPEKGTQ